MEDLPSTMTVVQYTVMENAGIGNHKSGFRHVESEVPLRMCMQSKVSGHPY